MATSRLNILALGLGLNIDLPKADRERYGSAELMVSQIENNIARCREVGLDVTALEVDVPSVEEGVRKVEAELRSGRYHCLMVGGGVKALPDWTPVLQKLVNMSRKIQPDLPIAFNKGPGDDYIEVLSREIKIPLA
jgi:hypothetical protein